MKLKIKKLTNTAIVPTYGTEGAAGIDLYAAEKVVVYPGETVLVRTGLVFAIPTGYVGLVVPRSGLSLRTSLRQPNCVGVIDSDYRGEVHGMFENTGDEIITIDSGIRFAQMVVVPFAPCDLVESEDLGETARGEGGFGSTGV